MRACQMIVWGDNCRVTSGSDDLTGVIDAAETFRQWDSQSLEVVHHHCANACTAAVLRFHDDSMGYVGTSVG